MWQEGDPKGIWCFIPGVEPYVPPFFPVPARATNKLRFVKHSVGRQGGWGKQRERGGLYCSRKKGKSAIWIAHWLVSSKGATGYLVRPLRMPTKFKSSSEKTNHAMKETSVLFCCKLFHFKNWRSFFASAAFLSPLFPLF